MQKRKSRSRRPKYKQGKNDSTAERAEHSGVECCNGADQSTPFGFEDFKEALLDDLDSGDKKASDLGLCCWCNKQASDLKKCTQCKVAQYCDRQCQKAHWSKHKLTCRDGGDPSFSTSETFHSRDGGAPSFSSSETFHSRVKKESGNMERKQLVNVVHSRPLHEQVPCFYCKKHKETLKKCQQCKIAVYCDRECQKAHWPEHKTACRNLSGKSSDQDAKQGNSDSEINDGPDHQNAHRNYPQFLKALDRASKTSAQVHSCKQTSFEFPPPPNPFLDHILGAQPDRKAVLLEIVGPYYHFLRHGVYVQDVTGEMVHMLFYHEQEEELSLFPTTMSRLLSKGNFMRWFYPRWRFFTDGTVGFRIDSLREIEFIENTWSFTFEDI